MSLKSPLRIRVKDGELVISIGAKTLAEAFYRGSPDPRDDFMILNELKFAKHVAHQLAHHEAEDGSTDITCALDRAMWLVIENGSDAVAEVGE